MSASTYHYCIVREDVPHGVQMAQLAHAAGESAGGPLPENTSVVILGVPSEGALRHIAKKLTDRGVPHKIIIETEGEYAGQVMSIGCAPVTDRKAIRKATSSLPLVGKPRKQALTSVPPDRARCSFEGECVGGCGVCAYGEDF